MIYKRLKLLLLILILLKVEISVVVIYKTSEHFKNFKLVNDSNIQTL